MTKATTEALDSQQLPEVVTPTSLAAALEGKRKASRTAPGSVLRLYKPADPSHHLVVFYPEVDGPLTTINRYDEKQSPVPKSYHLYESRDGSTYFDDDAREVHQENPPTPEETMTELLGLVEAWEPSVSDVRRAIGYAAIPRPRVSDENLGGGPQG